LCAFFIEYLTLLLSFLWISEFCLHVAAYNIKHGIMAYPSNFNPTRTGGGKKGRPAEAVPGDALNSGAREGKGK